MANPFPPPDPTAEPLSPAELAEGEEFADEGPVLDTGPSEIEIERGGADRDDHDGTAAPPEAELPPD